MCINQKFCAYVCHCDVPVLFPEFVLTSENVTEFDESGKSSTLPRMPQFKVPLMPQRYSSTMSERQEVYVHFSLTDCCKAGCKCHGIIIAITHPKS